MISLYAGYTLGISVKKKIEELDLTTGKLNENNELVIFHKIILHEICFKEVTLKVWSHFFKITCAKKIH